jgi:hypothetical protein
MTNLTNLTGFENLANATGVTAALEPVESFVAAAKEVIPYEAWMGLAIIFGLLVVLCKVPFISGMAKMILYGLIVVTAIVFGALLGLLNF